MIILPQDIYIKITRLIKKRSTDTSDLIGLNSIIMLSTDIFSRNEEIKFYTKEVFKEDYLPYLFKSRTLLIARTTREIYNYDTEEMDLFLNRILIFFKIEITETQIHPTKKKNLANENMKKWIRALDKND